MIKKILTRIVIVIGIVHIFYYGNLFFTYNNVDKEFADTPPIGKVYDISTGTNYHFKNILFLHAVNTAERAKVKERDFSGFEIDVSINDGGEIIVAHDDSDKTRMTSLDDIFGAIKYPEQQFYWLDLKVMPSQKHIDSILASAKNYGVPLDHMFFEAADPEAIALLTQNGLLFLYPVFGVTDDGGNTEKRNEINKRILDDIEKYQPYAVAATPSKYLYLRTYFPNIKKAIYYSTVKRPSFRKLFIMRQLMKDPTVDMIVLDEYTSLPF